MSKGTVMVVDDDPGVQATLRRACESVDFFVRATDCRDEFLSAVSDENLQLIIMDLQMPGCDGIEMMRSLAAVRTDVPLIIVSGHNQRVLHTAETLGRSLGLIVLDAMQKPVSIKTLIQYLKTVTASTDSLSAASLSEAIDSGQFRLFYQPKISCERDTFGQVMGFEALARWEHPNMGVVAPDRFIARAEEMQLIEPLTTCLLQEGLQQLRSWSDAGLAYNLAFNLSPFLLGDESLPDRYAELASAAGVDTSLVRFEITESGAMADPVMAMALLARLRLQGFGLSIDDFGTGYSSLIQLYNLPFSELKIDRSFVADIEHVEDARVIVRTLVDLAHNLSMKVCAEGVETQGQWNQLIEYGCERVQGYFVAKPTPAADIDAWLQDWQMRVKSLAVEDTFSMATTRWLKTSESVAGFS